MDKETETQTQTQIGTEAVSNTNTNTNINININTNDSTNDISELFTSKKKKNNSKKCKISLEFDEDQETILNEPIEIVKTNSPLNVNKLEFSYSQIETINPLSSSETSVTSINEMETEIDRDQLTRRKEAIDRSRNLASKGELDTKYRGLKGYQQFLVQGDTAKANAGSHKNRLAGPVRAVANLRITSRFDYKPDLCKDYNETGFCGFGDSCIFLHDRTEHKSSYQIEKEWNDEQKRKLLDEENVNSLVKLRPEDSLPLKPSTCTVCSNLFTRPVKTKCGHYFCETCVLRLNRCPLCKAALQGSFKPASKELL